MSGIDAPVQKSSAGQVVREMAEIAYQDYERRYGSSQSLDTLLQRGGFSWAELAFHLYSQYVRDVLPQHPPQRIDAVIKIR